MKRSQLTISAVFSIIFLLGCETVVDFDLPVHQPKLVVNSFIFPNITWGAEVSVSAGVLNEAPTQWVENAQVEIYKDGQLERSLPHLEDGKYQSPVLFPDDHAKPGSTYEIRVSADGYESVSAFSTVPLGVPIGNVNRNAGVGSNGEMIFEFDFNDPANVQNFYHVIFYFALEVEVTTGVFSTVWYPTKICSEDPTLVDYTEKSIGGFLFSDASFNGTPKSIDFISNVEFDAENPVKVELRNVSESYFRYQRSVSIQDETNGDPFAEPTLIFNNIEGGLGIFAGYNPSEVIVE